MKIDVQAYFEVIMFIFEYIYLHYTIIKIKKKNEFATNLDQILVYNVTLSQFRLNIVRY